MGASGRHLPYRWSNEPSNQAKNKINPPPNRRWRAFRELANYNTVMVMMMMMMVVVASRHHDDPPLPISMVVMMVVVAALYNQLSRLNSCSRLGFIDSLQLLCGIRNRF